MKRAQRCTCGSGPQNTLGAATFRHGPRCPRFGTTGQGRPLAPLGPTLTARVLRELAVLPPREVEPNLLRAAVSDVAGEEIAASIVASWKIRHRAIGWRSSPLGPLPLFATSPHDWQPSAQGTGRVCQVCYRLEEPVTPAVCTGRRWNGDPSLIGLEIHALVTAMHAGVRHAVQAIDGRQILWPVAPFSPPVP